MKRTPLKRTPLRTKKTPRKRTTKVNDELLALREAVILRAGNRCERCEQLCEGSYWGNAPHVHHVQLRSQGGSDTLDNLVLLCGRCHGFVHDNRKVAAEEGWIVQRSAP